MLISTRRLLALCILFFCTYSLVVSCGAFARPSSQHIAAKTNPLHEPLKMGCSYDWAGWWPWAVAQEQALFFTYSSNIELRWFDDYYAALNALAIGELDANCQVFNDTVEMAERAGEVVVLVTDNSAGNDKIIGANSVETLPDLIGQRVGVEKGKLTDFLLELAFESRGIQRDDVDIQYMNTATAAMLFLTHQLEATVAWQPDWLTALKRSGSHELLSSKDLPGALPQVIAVTQTAIDERPDDVQALVNTWFETLNFMAEQPAISQQIMQERSQLSSSNYQLFTDGVHIFSPTENQTAFTQGDNLEHLSYTAQKAADFLVKAGQIPQLPDLDKLLDDRFVRAYGNSKTARS